MPVYEIATLPNGRVTEKAVRVGPIGEITGFGNLLNVRLNRIIPRERGYNREYDGLVSLDNPNVLRLLSERYRFLIEEGDSHLVVSTIHPGLELLLGDGTEAVYKEERPDESLKRVVIKNGSVGLSPREGVKTLLPHRNTVLKIVWEFE